jgi:hypothetical protein
MAELGGLIRDRTFNEEDILRILARNLTSFERDRVI